MGYFFGSCVSLKTAETKKDPMNVLSPEDANGSSIHNIQSIKKNPLNVKRQYCLAFHEPHCNTGVIEKQGSGFQLKWFPFLKAPKGIRFYNNSLRACCLLWFSWVAAGSV